MSEPRIRISIDGEWIFKGRLGEWISKPPNQFKDAIKPGANPEPWMKAIMISMMDAVTQQQSMTIKVQTNGRDWDMSVKHDR